MALTPTDKEPTPEGAATTAAAEAPLTEKQQMERAWDLAESSSRLPPIATAAYRGPSEAISATVHGLVMGGIGYFLGHQFGRLGERSVREGEALGGRMWERTFRWGGAGILGFMGFQSSSREVRETRQQLSDLQELIGRVHDQNLALKRELRAQLIGKGRLSGYDDAWEKQRGMNAAGVAEPAIRETKDKAPMPEPTGDIVRDPKTQVSVADIAQHEVVKATEQPTVQM